MYEGYFCRHNTFEPLIPYDSFNLYFISENGHFSSRSEDNYYLNIIKFVSDSSKQFFSIEETRLFNFKNNFFPKNIATNKNKFNYLKIFSSLIDNQRPADIFELDKIIICCIYKYLNSIEMKPSIWQVFLYYFAINRKDYEYLIFDVKDINLKINNLLDLFNVIKISLKDNSEISKLINVEFNKISSPSCYKKIKLELDFVNENTLIYINENQIDIENIEYAYLDEDKIQFRSLENENINLLKNSKYLFVQEFENKFQLIILPNVLIRMFEVIKSRRDNYNQGINWSLYKPNISLYELRQNPDFSDAMTVLRHHYKYNSDLFADDNERELHLYRWLNIFDNIDQIYAALHIISKHRYFSKEEIDFFFDKLREYQSNKNYLITTLQNASDNNGIQRLLNLNVEKAAWRSQNNEFQDFPQKLINSADTNTVVFLIDNCISGNQILTAFKKHYLSEKLLSIDKQQEYKYQKIQEKFDDFKSKILSMSKIIFLGVLITNESKEKIKKYFKEDNNFNGEVEFMSKEILSFNNCIFNSINDRKHSKNFKEMISDVEYIKSKFNVTKFAEKCSELALNDNILDRNLIARFNSLPKKRFFLFTLPPKHYKYSLFQYIGDS